MQYITTKAFNKDGIWGHFDIQLNTVVESINNILCIENKQICHVTSQNAHEHFTRNDDNDGVRRRELIDTIINILTTYAEEYKAQVEAIASDMMIPPDERQRMIEALDNKAQDAYDIMMQDDVAKTFLTNGLWNHAFYNAEINDLLHLIEII